MKMEELINMVIADESPSDISDKIKEILQIKSIEKINQIRPEVASSMLGSEFNNEEVYEDETQEE